MSALPGTSPATAVACLVVAVIAAGLLWRQAIRRPDRRWLAPRVIATGVAILALLLLVLQPARRPVARGTAIVLLTPGADQLDRTRLAALLRGRRVFALPGSGVLPPGAQPIGAPGALHALGLIDSVVVAGFGLDEAQAAELPPAPVTVIQPPLPPGPRFAAWAAQVRLGDRLRVSGTATMPRGRPGWIVLEGPAGPVDSANVTGPAAEFSLSAAPRSTGPVPYRLLLRVGRESVAEDTIAAMVALPRPIRVLVIEASPRFGSRMLQDWLAGLGGTVIVKSVVTRDRWVARVSNAPMAEAARTVAALARDVDVVVTDVRSLTAMSPGDREAIRQSVTDLGLGLLVLPDSLGTLPPAAGLEFFLGPGWIARDADARTTVRPSLPGIEAGSVTPVDGEPYAFRNPDRWTPVLTDAAGALVVAGIRRGQGVVAVSMVAAPDQWALRGESRSFAGYWSALLRAVARPDGLLTGWRVGAPALVDQETSIEYRGRLETGIGLVTVQDRIDTVYLAPINADSTRWAGRYWPRGGGWHRISGPSGSPAVFRVSGPAGWPAWQAARREEATRALAGHPTPSARSTSGPLPSEPIPALWWVGLFVVAVGYLWWEQRP